MTGGQSQSAGIVVDDTAIRVGGDTRMETLGSAPRWRLALTALLHHRLGAFGLCVCALVVFTALLAPWIAPYDPSVSDYEAILSPPSLAHWLGTDDLGRDILSRIVWGTQVSLQVSLIAVSGAIVLGSVVGMISGYAGGWIDDAIMRVIDAMLAFPTLILALGIVAVLGPTLVNAMIAITIVNIPNFARLVRAQVLSIRHMDFVSAARGLGASRVRIMFRHIWPSVIGNVLVYGSLTASTALITESSLSFLGLGAQPPTPSWGSMLSSGMQYWDAWWMSVFPGVALFSVVLALNFVGDSLRDVLDARITE
ncbi:dipeptide ABC transporter membrane subunit DppC [Chelatococcus asaccharovorans]|nr:dipeptide ABC transporter membrane subunit DppC [Chelatococcus asaccharovorans]CAH1692081.1 dipeptide ABC transporter membrane subunit DppC [Chelatococcus asaccharovorans]